MANHMKAEKRLHLLNLLCEGNSIRGTARLCDTNLAGAWVRDANLFRATLENARLEGAVFTGANMYEVEFYQAAIDGTHFEGANLKGTKLA